MDECPNKRCEDKVNRLDRAVFDETGESCIMPKSWLWKGITTFGVAFLIGGIYLYAGVNNAASRDRVVRNEALIQNLKERNNDMADTLIDINRQLIQMRQEMNTIPIQVIKMLSKNSKDSGS